MIYGVPYDTGVSFRPGARFGPRSIREQSQYLKRYHPEHDVDLVEELTMADAGDAPVSPYHPKECLDGVCDWATALPGAGKDYPKTKLIALGGDHSIAYANIKATWHRMGKPAGGLALAHFDSHLDTVDVVWKEKYGHASPFRRLIEEGIINPHQMFSIGIKGPMYSKADLGYAREHGIRICTHDQWRTGGDTPLRDFVRRLEDAPCYLTFDIDCVDPVFAPGTGTPAPGGFTSAEALVLVRACAGLNIVGADVVEVLPDRDVAGNTALLAAHIAFEIMALDPVHRRMGGRAPKLS